MLARDFRASGKVDLAHVPSLAQFPDPRSHLSGCGHSDVFITIRQVWVLREAERRKAMGIDCVARFAASVSGPAWATIRSTLRRTS